MTFIDGVLATAVLLGLVLNPVSAGGGLTQPPAMSSCTTEPKRLAQHLPTDPGARMSYVTGDAGASSNEGFSVADDQALAAVVRRTAIAWWHTAIGALLVGFVALLCVLVTHHWTPSLAIASVVLAAIFGLGGLARWNDVAYAEDDPRGEEFERRWLFAIAIGMIALVIATLFAV